MSLIFSAIFLVLILFRVYGAAYDGPSRPRPKWARWLDYGLAVLFILFVVILAEQILILWNV